MTAPRPHSSPVMESARRSAAQRKIGGWFVVARTALRLSYAAWPLLLGACGATNTDHRSGEHTGSVRSPVVYGSDGRVEVAEVDDAVLRDLAVANIVALMPVAVVVTAGEGVTLSTPTWGESANLCPGVRFADQPAAAFCTGILVGGQTVLTAGHCLRHVPCEDTAFVLGYVEESARPASGFAGATLYACESVLGRELSAPTDSERFDYAWVRLDRPVDKPVRALEFRAWDDALEEGELVTLVGFGGGVPMKVSQDGLVGDARADSRDYFLTTTDAFHGDSGAPIFDSQRRLVGVDVRGNADYRLTPAGCNEVSELEDTVQTAGEQVTYARRALEDLCDERPDAEPCTTGRQEQRALDARPGGCTMGALSGRPSGREIVALALMVLTIQRRRVARPPTLTRRKRSGVVSTPPASTQQTTRDRTQLTLHADRWARTEPSCYPPFPMTVAKDHGSLNREVVFERDGFRYYEAPRPLHFPSEEKVPEGKQHLKLRTALYQILELAFGSVHGIGSDQFVYWDATDPRRCLAPDAFVRLGGPNDVFRVWKVWERGAPHVAVEVISATERDVDQEAQLVRYRQMGVAELVRFDCDDDERPLRVWDRTDDDLVERTLERRTSAECRPLGIFWVVVDDPELGRALRPAHDPEGRELLPTPVERERREHEREREEAQRRIRELEEQLRRR